LDRARRSDLSQVREHARQHRQARVEYGRLAPAPGGLREFRHCQDRDGMIRGNFALPPETGLPFVRRVEADALRRRRAARAGGGDSERFEAHAADALAGLVAGATNDHRKRDVRTELVWLAATTTTRSKPNRTAKPDYSDPTPHDSWRVAPSRPTQ